MKKTRIENYFLIIALTFMVAACTPEQKPCPPPKSFGKKTITSPITHIERLILMHEREYYFTLFKNGVHSIPLHIEPTINVSDFKNYYNEINSTQLYDGIRIYPAYRNNHIFYIMCLADTLDESKKLESGYVLLDKSTFPKHSFSIANIVDSSIAGRWHRNYIDSIYIDEKKQSSYHDKNFIKLSRFYKWPDLEKLMKDNLMEGNISFPDSNFYLKFETGYVNSDIAAKFMKRVYPKVTETQLQGFTVIIHLQDTNGFSLIDPGAMYEENKYKDRYLEVGNPCPPRCGQLHSLE